MNRKNHEHDRCFEGEELRMFVIDRFVIARPFDECWNSKKMLTREQPYQGTENEGTDGAESVHAILEIEGCSQLRDQKNVDQISGEVEELVDRFKCQG